MTGDTVVSLPREGHRPLREAIAPHLVTFNAAADVKGFAVIAVGDDGEGGAVYELRTDMCVAEAQAWLARVAIALGVPS